MVKPMSCEGIGAIDLNDARAVRALTEKEEYILSADENYGNKDGYLTCDEYIQWHMGNPKDKYIVAFKKLIKIVDGAKKKVGERKISLDDLLSSNTLGASGAIAEILKLHHDAFRKKVAKIFEPSPGERSKTEMEKKANEVQRIQDENYKQLLDEYHHITNRAEFYFNRSLSDFRKKANSDFIRPLNELKLQANGFYKKGKLNEHQYQYLVNLVSEKIKELQSKMTS